MRFSFASVQGRDQNLLTTTFPRRFNPLGFSVPFIITLVTERSYILIITLKENASLKACENLIPTCKKGCECYKCSFGCGLSLPFSGNLPYNFQASGLH
jgi:hypothetical protein